MANILRIEENERIDKTDFDFLSESAILSDQEFVANFLVDPLRSISGEAQRAFVLEGFIPSQSSSTQVSVTTGKAVLAYRDVGIVKYGAFTVGGDVAKTLTVTGASSTYYVWLRFDYLDGELGSRIFWNPTGDGTEFANTINTRQIPSWSIRIEDYTQGSPGSEWTKIGEVVWTGSAITSVTDTRHLFFEGVAGSSYKPNWSSDGGGLATDRNADRSTYGVKSLQTFTAAVRQCLEDIKGRGLRKWYSRDIGGLNIGFDAAPTEDTLAVGDAAFYMSLNSSTHVAKLEFMANYSIGMDRDFPAIILTTNGVVGLLVADTTARFGGDLSIGGTTLSFTHTDPLIQFGTGSTISYTTSGKTLTTVIDTVTTTLFHKSYTRFYEVGRFDDGWEVGGPGTTFLAFLDGTEPTIQFDEHDCLIYDPSANSYYFSIGSSQIMSITTDTTTNYRHELTLGTTYPLTITAGTTGSNAYILFDTNNNRMSYNSSILSFRMNSTDSASINSSGVSARTLHAQTLDAAYTSTGVTYTGVTAGVGSGGGTVVAGGNSSTGWIKVYVGSSLKYVPYWTNI